jgi:hypothetical protein
MKTRSLLIAGLAAASVGLAACGTAGASSPTNRAVAAWWDANQVDYQAIPKNHTAISNAADDHDYVGVAAACRTLGDDVATLQADPPIPVESANAPYQAALRLEAKSAVECHDGASSGDDAAIKAATADIGAAGDQWTAATSALDAATGGS